MFKVQHLTITKTDGNNLLQNLNFQLNNHDKLAIIGEEGTGKSTLLNIMSGFCVDYVDVKGNTVCDGKIGYFHQSFSLRMVGRNCFRLFVKRYFRIGNRMVLDTNERKRSSTSF